jgi:hypothetical protein
MTVIAINSNSNVHVALAYILRKAINFGEQRKMSYSPIEHVFEVIFEDIIPPEVTIGGGILGFLIYVIYKIRKKLKNRAKQDDS